MNLTLHLTGRCNLACTYCESRREGPAMSPAVLHAAMDLASRGQRQAGFCFFGGEPLLERSLIEDAVDYGKLISRRTGCKFYYKITTNGLLLDEPFLRLAKAHGIVIALSHDGLAQDVCRRHGDGSGTAAELEKVIALLLDIKPHSVVMSTFTPQTVPTLASSVEWLFQKGFRYLVTTPARGAHIGWDEEALRELEGQYRAMAALYERWTMAGERFYLGQLDEKLSSHICGGCGRECHLGLDQLSVAPDGGIYPCTQFVGDGDYRMGDVFTGIDPQRQAALSAHRVAPPACGDCAVAGRCVHTCACMNRMETGSMDAVSPFQCANERMLLPIADALGRRLYQKRGRAFLEKHYDALYPLLPLISK